MIKNFYGFIKESNVEEMENIKFFDGKVSGRVSLLFVPVPVAEGTIPDTIPVPTPSFYTTIYSEPITVDIAPTDVVADVVKEAAAKQLGVTFI